MSSSPTLSSKTTTVKPPLENFTVRRAESIDAPQIMKLIERITEKCFGKVNVVNVIEKAVFSVTLTSSSGEVIGFGAFYDYPNTSIYNSVDWEKHLPERHNLPLVTPLNSMFLHFFVAKRPYQSDIAREIVRTVFNSCIFVQYIFLFSKTTNVGSALLDSFSRQKDSPKEEKMFLCHRHAHHPQLHIRIAKPEDNDDLLPLFTAQSKVLTEAYGDYFLAELIEAQDDEHKALVAEVNGLAVGFMSLSSKVNDKLLNECFELKPYNFLQGKRDPEDDYESSVGSETVDTPVLLEPSHGENSSEEMEKNIKLEVPYITELGVAADEHGSSREEVVAAIDQLTPTVTVQRPSTASVDLESMISASIASHSRSESDSSYDCIVLERKKSSMVLEAEADEAADYDLYKPSSFCIQLFCIDDRYETRSIDFLAEAFKLFPGKEYCVITVPQTIPEFSILQFFSRVTPKSQATLHHELYVFHSSSLLQNIKVRFATDKDREGVSYVARKFKGKTKLLEDYHKYLAAYRDDDGTPLFTLVAEFWDQIVGVAVIRTETDIDFIRSHYNLEDFIYFTHHKFSEHGRINHWAISATFSYYTKHFMRECMRLCNMSCLYYMMYPGYAKPTKPISTVECIYEMIQVSPRRQIVYPLENLKGSLPATFDNRPSPNTIKDIPPFSVFHINRKLTHEPKITVNSRVVVVGASEVALSFIESLVLTPHIHFNNIILVSPEGLPVEAYPTHPTSLCYDSKYMNMINLGASLNVVKSKMISMNREEKFIEVIDGRKINYDYLILATGCQLMMPEFKNEAEHIDGVVSSPVRRNVTEISKPIPYSPPRQVVTIDSLEKSKLISDNAKVNNGPVLVYGHTLISYTLIRHLLDEGISDIIHVMPPHSISCFNNPIVHEKVSDAMSQLGIKVHNSLVINMINTDDEGDLSSIEFLPTEGAYQTIQCKTAILVNDFAVDNNLFESVNNSCLVFDGRLVIDTQCHTNDPVIYAAGPLTKYKRGLYFDGWEHETFNSCEIGRRLAAIMLPLFDPSSPKLPELQKYEFPKFVQPKKLFAKLPGGYNYLHVWKPAPQIDMRISVLEPGHGKELVTEKSGYFRIHINKYETIETITCLAKDDIAVDNIVELYGLHEQYMNELCKRYESDMIDDFFEFFKQPWALLLFHDRFPELRSDMVELLSVANAPGEIPLSDKILKIVDEDLHVDKSTKDQILKEYLESHARKLIEKRLFSYLSYNKNHLQHYAARNMA